MLTGDNWSKADGSHGSDTFNADGSSSGTTVNADGSYSTYTNDGQGDITTDAYTAAGVLTGDTWSKADGSHGSDTFNADGSSSGSAYASDGSYTTYSNDGQGDVTNDAYSAAGLLAGDTWSKADGSHGSDTFNADGSSTGTTVNADGSYSAYSNDGQGDLTTDAYTAAGVLTGDTWSKANGSHGSDTFNADGSSSGTTVNADGSHSSYSNDGQGDITTDAFSAAGVLTGDTWSKSNGSHGSDTFNADGSSSGTTVNADGSYSTYSNDGQGDITTDAYTAAGVLSGDTWSKADGSHGSDTFNADGSSSGMTVNADGSSSTYTNDGQGDLTTLDYDTAGNYTGDQWQRANGASGSDSYDSATGQLTVDYTLAAGTAVTWSSSPSGNGTLTTSTVADTALAGVAGADSIFGSGANDTLTAGPGGEVVYGSGDGDVIVGGSGNDLLIGTGNNDTFLINAGDGIDTIIAAGANATLEFGPGVTPDMITLGIGSLLVRVGSSNDEVHIEGFDPSNALDTSAIANFQFADGSVMTQDQMLARGFDLYAGSGDVVVTGTDLDNQIYGGSGNDTLIGAGQNDTLAAGSGIDFSRALLVRSRLAEALDAAGLAVGASQGLTQTQMQALAQNYFDANYPAGNSCGMPAPVSITFGNQQVSLSASVQMPTTLMNIVGIKTMDVAHTSKIVWGQTKLWVGLVLDNTGSMSESDSSGSKIDALKSATHSLLTMLQNASSTPGDVKASIIPFSKDVSFKALPDGTSNINASWIDWSDWLAPPVNFMPSASVGPGSSCPYSSWSNGFACTQGPANGSWNTNTIPSSGSYAGYICPSRDNGRVDPGRNGHYYNGCYDSVPTGTTTTSCVTPWGGSTSCTTTTSSDPYTGSTATACSYDSSYTKTCITRTGAPYTHNWIATDKGTWDGCFMDRAQSYDEQNDQATGGSTDFPAENASSCPPAQIAPLSYDWTALNSEVESMTPNGNTNQTIGLARPSSVSAMPNISMAAGLATTTRQSRSTSITASLIVESRVSRRRMRRVSRSSSSPRACSASFNCCSAWRRCRRRLAAWTYHTSPAAIPTNHSIQASINPRRPLPRSDNPCPEQYQHNPRSQSPPRPCAGV